MAGSILRSHRRWLTPLVGLAVLALAALVPACSLNGTPSGYDVKAVFSSAIGLYANSPVRVQGINVGQVLDVKPDGKDVVVKLRIANGRDLPRDAKAYIIPESLLGERYVQLAPVYDGGPKLPAGATIGLHRTSVPSEFDDLLRSLQDFSGKIDPKNATDLIDNLADLLAGQGKSLNDLIQSGAGTLKLLADKSDHLGDIIDALAQLSTTLQGHTTEIQHLIDSYNSLSEVLATSSGDLSNTITNLDQAAAEITDLLQQHAQPLQSDVAQLTHATRTLDRNFDGVSTMLSSTVRLFTAAGRAYDPVRNMLNMNNQLDVGYTAEIAASRIRDRVAGICRRLHIGACSDSSSLNALIEPIVRLLQGLPVVNNPKPTANPSGSASSPAQPAAPSSPPAPTTTADLQAAVQQMLGRAGTLSADQQKALAGLNNPLLLAITNLGDDELNTLAKLNAAQLASLRKVSPDKLGLTLDQIRMGSLDPQTLVGPVIKPLPGDGGSGGLNGLVGTVLSGLASLGGGS